jgi:hypothetical protein
VKAFPGLTKLKKLAQAKSDASGWNRHVNKFQKRIANKVLRRILRRDIADG